MKKLSLILLLLVSLCVSCGDDEPNYNKKPKINRPQDGNGKVFIENGKLVDGNIDYSDAQLSEALKCYDWKKQYSFYYDNDKVSGKMDIDGMPTIIHANGNMEYWSLDGSYISTSTINLKGKLLITSQQRDPSSGSIYLAKTYIVTALDISDGKGRMIIDFKLQQEIPGYDYSSSFVRMVWEGTVSQ